MAKAVFLEIHAKLVGSVRCSQVEDQKMDEEFAVAREEWRPACRLVPEDLSEIWMGVKRRPNIPMRRGKREHVLDLPVPRVRPEIEASKEKAGDDASVLKKAYPINACPCRKSHPGIIPHPRISDH